MRYLFLIFTCFFLLCFHVFLRAESVILAKNGKVFYSIDLSNQTSESEKFATNELQRYLGDLSNSTFKVSTTKKGKRIILSIDNSLPEESYRIFLKAENIYLSGGSQRAILFAVYDFLQRLGCCWVAPSYNFYEGTNLNIPFNKELRFEFLKPINENPNFKYRKFYVEEGRTHTLENLRQLIDWMPKVRMNTLVFPIDYEGKGVIKWDNWRDELISELKNRSIQIEVGGHGYQNFINTTMENNTLFEKHPEWFGMDDTGARSKDYRRVICTSNSDAVQYLYNNLLKYLRNHPEIDIFDFWPPDSEKWCQCDNCKTLGNETERHIILVNHVEKLLVKDLPNVKLECLAYNKYTSPPTSAILKESVLLDFCPINQNFEYQIYEKGNNHNEGYNESLNEWFNNFKGDISIYSYYRKYAWRSLPNSIPHYMQKDLKYYQKLGIQGVSIYSEPGDWFTYGLNHYVFSSLVWNPTINVDSLINNYSRVVFENSEKIAIHIYSELEDIVRFACNIAQTLQKDTQTYEKYAERVENCRKRLGKEIQHRKFEDNNMQNLQKLDLMLQYTLKSIQYMHSKSIDNDELAKKINLEIRSFLKTHETEGVFIPHRN